MGDKRNFASLDWVVDEISDTLKEARQSLEAYVEDPKDSTRIRFCLTHIHQVHGSLQMVEFHGAALLAEEMEHAAQAIMDHEVASIPEAQEVLMRSLLQLPIFLEHVKNTKEDNPAGVMPLLNDLRAVRKQSYLSETNLFSPDLSSLQKPSGQRHPVLADKAKLHQVIKKLREMYQFAAASVLRGIKVEENLEYLDKVFSRLELITQGTLGNPIWEVSSALVDALKRDELELTVGVKGLLRYIARELRMLGEKAPEILDQPPRESLLKNLLYYVSRAELGSEKVAKITEKYDLDNALVGSGEGGHKAKDDVLRAPDASAIRSVVIALQDELGSIKHILDLSLSGNGSVDDLKDVIPSVKRVTDTLAVLGIGDLRKQMLEQTKRLEIISEANSVDEKALILVANSIIKIEHRLKAIAKSAGKHTDLAAVNEREVEIDNAKAAVIKECSSGLLKSKDSIIEYISSQWDKQHLGDVDSSLKDICGGLNMIPLPRPAAIIAACGRFIQEKLIEGTEHPSFEHLESLADAIASVEYYLERLMEDLYEDSDSMLDIAEDSITGLGYPPLGSESSTSAPSNPLETSEPEPFDSFDNLEVAEEDSGAIPVAADVDAGQAVEAPKTSVPAKAKPALAVSVPKTVAEVAVPGIPVAVPGIPVAVPGIPVAVPATPVVVADEFESDIDEEIIEIFIEEAGEVLETLAEYYPKWREKESDQDSLVVVRRAFHTLKGSGRMVEAFDIGELAWSVENTLNRVIDRTIKVTPHLHHLVDAVIALIPTLVEAFKQRQENPQKALTEQYQAWGHELVEGKPPEALANALPAIKLSEIAPAVVSDTPVESDSQVVDIVAEDLLESDEDQEFDRVLQEIFSQESTTHLETLQGFISRMEEDAPLYSVPTDELQRALHTLKGSAKMAQVWPIAHISEPLEHFMKELTTFQVSINDDILQLIKDAAEYIKGAVSQIDSGKQIVIAKTEQFVARTKELRDLAIADLVLPKNANEISPKVDPRMLSLVMAEEMALLLEADSLLRRWQDNNANDEELNRLLAELSVLEEGARQANLNEMAALSALLTESYKQARSLNLATDDVFFMLMQQGHEALLDMVDAVAAAQNVQTAPELVTQGIAKLLESAAAKTPAVTAPEFESADSQLEHEPPATDVVHLDDIEVPADISIVSPEDIPEDLVAVLGDELELSSQTEQPEPVAKKAEEVAEVQPKPERASVVAVVIPGLIDAINIHSEDYDGDIVEVFLEEAEELAEALDEAIHTWENNWSDENAVEEITRILHTLKGGARLAGFNKMGDLTHDYESVLMDMGEDNSNVNADFFTKIHVYQDQVLRATRAIKQFVEGDYEAAAIDTGEPAAEVPEEPIVSEPSQVEEKPTADTDKAPAADTEKAPTTDTEKAATADTEKAPTTDIEKAPAPVTSVEADKGNVVKFEPKAKTKSLAPATAPAEFVMPKVSRAASGGAAVASVAVKKSGPQEVVKISAELLEELVNLAGETSINRSRLEQYVNDFGFSLDEIDSTLNRLHDQLRRLDIETEAQILFRQEQMEAHDDFDPLEMDRYSNLQQLSRSLNESASDLIDLKLDLSDRLKSTETLLLQQSRVNTTLQEGLMRSRMVPFSRLIPRLRRIVRQVSTELGKNVSFELDNVEGELDRSVLERMVPPFEHMLRNAVDHGIELPEDRMAAGKSETGRIVLTLSREGSDVLIRLADDGRGVDLKRVREKAIERELMAADAELSDHDVMQFILHAGFSTAENITQISGRGVGMDVVNAEIKQLGGSVTINSAWGKGTEFIVRLPFTLSVNRALMIAIGNDHYAVPLSSIEGIVRVSPFELEHYYANPEAQFEYANENYHVRYLGSLLYNGAVAKLEGGVLPLPVLLVRSAEHTMALQVDAVMGSREIVVKSLGQQFSAVPGLSGATVMGDGSVVVILDPHALVRQEIARANLSLEHDDPALLPVDDVEEISVRRVMVVDDSVTVRKVTTRFLEREGFEVVTAKDGVDALRLLQDGLPDLMLLDIEMPRMDGFEVAKTVRTTKRWKELPIIMITSRTGDKHREHAESLGVNDYLGKPYQEDILLEAIGRILDPEPLA